MQKIEKEKRKEEQKMMYAGTRVSSLCRSHQPHSTPSFCRFLLLYIYLTVKGVKKIVASTSTCTYDNIDNLVP